MLRVFFFIFLSIFLYAKELPVDIFAKKVEYKDSKVVARDDVVIVYDDYYIEADRAIYDKNSSIIELFGKISLLKNSSYIVLSDYSIFDMKNKKIYSKPFFFREHKDNVWISSCDAKKEDSVFNLKKAIVSSCNPTNPDWKIEFSKGDYNEKKKWVNLYNAILYAKNTPIFYTPYLGFSTSKERKSGLLKPGFAYSNKEGFVYIQPFYLAPDPQWDLEISPQIRSNRGKGAYTTFRFVDTPYSFGKISTGFFKEKSSFIKQESLKNDKHYGFEAFYRRDALFVDKKSANRSDGLYLDFKYLNDIDYLNLKESSIESSYGSLVTSRFNYYYNQYDHYFGLYLKYFIDTSKVDNSDTLQILPKLQYHKYTNSLFLNNILYSVDFKFTNLYREKGVNAKQYELNIPFSIYFNSLNDYVGLSFSENMYASYVDYSNYSQRLKNGLFIRNYHKFSIYSDLIKSYSSFLHTIHLNGSLIIPSYEKDRGDKEDFISINSETKRLELSLKEYFYNLKGDEFLYHRVIQPIFYDKEDRFGDLENEIGFNIDRVRVSNDIFYSHKYNSISSIATSISYSDAMISAIASHFYKNGFENEKDSNFLNTSFNYNLSKRYKIFGKIGYNIEDKFIKEWNFGWRFYKKCWSYEISYNEKTVPILTSIGSSSYKDRSILFRVELFPLGGVEYEFRHKNTISD